LDPITSDNAEAASVLAPATRPITGNGKHYEVRRLETRQIWPILRAGLPILEGLSRMVAPASSPAVDSPQSDGGRPPGPALDSTPGITKLVGSDAAAFLRTMAEHGDRVTEILAIALDTTIKEVGRFEPQETYLALKAVIEVNRDFFTHRVAPMLGLDTAGMGESALAGAVSRALGASGISGAGPTR
jgi:hypothetical protein